MKKTLQRILGEYGPIALVVYLVIFNVMLLGAWAAIRFGWQPQSVAGSVGTFTAAYVVTKLTQPARIALTLVITPGAARLYRRFAGKPAA